MSISACLGDVRQQSGRMPSRLAIVDSAPREQFLYPEFELYAGAFREHGVDCVIRAPEELSLGPDGLADAHGRIDMVYNRLTDFALEEASNTDLRQAYLAGEIALTPHPRAHRSEEHTSELQSLMRISYAVFCLKKKKYTKTKNKYPYQM